ncbi:MAG: thiol reductant ABC exporter subunit CydC [Clostridiales Family XIII bacterium]|jgi:ATP-binding cassette subfamily C protein CydC|nr:thiol reductant ABC exporter subunit CydC [Clostridiales Family XIII bacterium]
MPYKGQRLEPDFPDLTAQPGTLARLLSLMRPYWIPMGLAGLCGAATILANVGLLAASAVLISEAALRPALFDLMILISAVRFFGTARAVLRYLERYMTHDVTFRILKKLRVWFYRGVEPLAPAILEERSEATLFKQITKDIEILQFFYLRVLAAPFIAFTVLAVCSVFLAFFSPGASAILLAFYIVGGVAVPVIVRRATRGLAEKQARIWDAFYVRVVDFVQGLAELAANGALDEMRGEIRVYLNDVTECKKKLYAAENLTGCLIQWFSHVAMLCALLASVPLVVSGRMEGVLLAMIGLTVQAAFEALLPMPLALEQLDEGLTAAGRLFSLATPGDDAAPEAAEAPADVMTAPAGGTARPAALDEASGAPKAPAATSGAYGITFKDVNFSYGENEGFSLSGISFHMPEGAKFAIVGSSGAGKSTLIQLLLKFRPYKGSITIGGKELRDMQDAEARGIFGVLNQEPYIFYASVRENIMLARGDASEGDMIEACRLAKLHDFIMSLPEGYDTHVGENGFLLSGGQRQRLALARVFLKGSPVVLLDEADQGLDTLTAKEIRDSLRGWAKGRSVLSISHSLQGLDGLDQIISMEEGRIIEMGSHAALLGQNGFYAKLYGLTDNVELALPAG